MKFSATENEIILEKSKYKHLNSLPNKEYFRLVNIVKKHKATLDHNKGCEKVFIRLCRKNGRELPKDFMFFDFCLLMSTIARDQLLLNNDDVNDELDIILTMGVNMLPYKQHM